MHTGVRFFNVRKHMMATGKNNLKKNYSFYCTLILLTIKTLIIHQNKDFQVLIPLWYCLCLLEGHHQTMKSQKVGTLTNTKMI